jgi:hypothetical protein
MHDEPLIESKENLKNRDSEGRKIKEIMLENLAIDQFESFTDFFDIIFKTQPIETSACTIYDEYSDKCV